MTIAVAFLSVFAAVAVAVSSAWTVLDSRRKRQVDELLQTVARERVVEAALLRDTPDARTPLIERLGAMRLAGWLEVRIRQSGLDWTVEHFTVLSGLAAAGGVLFGLVAPVPLPPVARIAAFGGAFALAPGWKVSRARARRIAAFEEQFPEALDFLARSMRAGHAFTISLELLAEEMPDPLAREIRTLSNEHNLGAPLEQALARLIDRVPLLDVRFFASAVVMQKQTGGNLNEILSRLAYVIRERFRLKGQVRAASAHGRMTAGILMAMPVATFCALWLLAPSYIQGMLADSDGRRLLAGCVMAQVVGSCVIRRIIDITV